jgi:hypothetical protein
LQIFSIGGLLLQLIHAQLLQRYTLISHLIPKIVETSYDFRGEVGIRDGVCVHHSRAQLFGELITFCIHEVDEEFADLAKLLRFPEASGVDLVFCGGHQTTGIQPSVSW